MSLQDDWNVVNDAQDGGTTLGTQSLGHDLVHSSLDPLHLTTLNTQLDLTDLETLFQEHTRNLSNSEYMLNIAATSTGQGDSLRGTLSDSLSTEEDLSQEATSGADRDEDITELMRLGNIFASTIEFYRRNRKPASGQQVEQDIEHQRSILRAGIGASELYHRLLCRINNDIKHRGIRREYDLSLETETLLAQATSCYFMQARQWIVTLEALRSRFPSPSLIKTAILKILPSTLIEGLSSERLILKAQMFFYACVKITRSTRRQMEMLQSYLSKSRSASDNLAWPAERVESLHAQLDQVLDSSD